MIDEYNVHRHNHHVYDTLEYRLQLKWQRAKQTRRTENKDRQILIISFSQTNFTYKDSHFELIEKRSFSQEKINNDLKISVLIFDLIDDTDFV